MTPLEAVAIRNRAGEQVGILHLNPADGGMIDRSKEASRRIADIAGSIVNLSIRPDGTTANEDMPALLGAEQRVYAAFDYLLGGNASEAFFGALRPFAVVGGRFYCSSAIDAVDRWLQHHAESKTKS